MQAKESTEIASQKTVEEILTRRGVVLTEYETESIAGMTPLQVVSFLMNQLLKVYSNEGPCAWEKTKKYQAAMDILAIPSEAKRFRQISEFSESLRSRFPSSDDYDSPRGEEMARFLESELLPNLPKQYRERVSTLINHVRAGAYGAYTDHIIYRGQHHDSFQQIFGIEVLCVKFMDILDRRGACFLKIDLSRDWQVDGSADRKIDPVEPFKLSKNAQRTVDLTLASFDGRHQLPSDLKNYSPEVLAHKLCTEALRLEAVFPSWYRGATWQDLNDIGESKQVVKDLRAAADRIAKLK